MHTSGPGGGHGAGNPLLCESWGALSASEQGALPAP